MERLTVKRSDGRWALANNDGAKPLKQMEKIPIAIDRLAAYEDALPLERAQELAQAEKDGRLVVLPVPIGTNKLAYALPVSFSRNQEIFTIECERLEGLEIWDNPSHEIVVVVDGCEIGQSDIGKTVFLTREEAEAALKKREADNETD